MMEHHKLETLVDLSDVAIRMSSQLRRLHKGDKAALVQDRTCIEAAVGFLETAVDGGAFFSGRSHHFGQTLEPLNWATDVYVQSSRPHSAQVDYTEATTYFESLLSTLKQLHSGEVPDSQAMADAESFFESLAELLSQAADTAIRTSRPGQLAQAV